MLSKHARFALFLVSGLALSGASADADPYRHEGYISFFWSKAGLKEGKPTVVKILEGKATVKDPPGEPQQDVFDGVVTLPGGWLRVYRDGCHDAEPGKFKVVSVEMKMEIDGVPFNFTTGDHAPGLVEVPQGKDDKGNPKPSIQVSAKKVPKKNLWYQLDSIEIPCWGTPPTDTAPKYWPRIASLEELQGEWFTYSCGSMTDEGCAYYIREDDEQATTREIEQEVFISEDDSTP